MTRELVDADISKDKTFFFVTVLILTYLVVISANITRITQIRKTGRGLSFFGPRLNMQAPDVDLLMTTATVALLTGTRTVCSHQSRKIKGMRQMLSQCLTFEASEDIDNAPQIG